MQRLFATLWVALLGLVVAAPAALAEPTEVNVRIEGKTETLFEGPILTDERKVTASSDIAWRRCNGLNNDQYAAPGPTPTASSVAAMAILGEDFDGDWYAEPFEDYFITRWGPDGQSPADNEYWGILVNNVFTNVGGCQYQVDEGDEILWIYDAFDGRSRLALYPADYTGGPQVTTDVVEVDQPYEVEVDTRDGYNEGVPPDSPGREGAIPYEGAVVAPVETAGNGFQSALTDDPAAEETDAGGRASIVFDEPGWHRIKAAERDEEGNELVVRSNRIDVCAYEATPDECGEPPADARLRIPPPSEEPEGEVEEPSGGVVDPQADPVGAPRTIATAVAPRVRVALRRLDRRLVRKKGIVKARWRVLDRGVGIRQWMVQVKKLGEERGKKKPRFVTKARGKRKNWARIRLGGGARYKVRIVVVDAIGRRSGAVLGTVWVPRR